MLLRSWKVMRLTGMRLVVTGSTLLTLIIIVITVMQYSVDVLPVKATVCQTNIFHQKQETDLEYQIPPDVHYFWCGPKRFFEFRHYLSVLSVVRYLRPYRIVLHYEREPKIDESGYHTWLLELVDKYPFFSREHLPSGWCDADRESSIDDYLFQIGGIYVREDVVLTSSSIKRYLSSNFVSFNDDLTSSRLIVMSNIKCRQSNEAVQTSSVKLLRGGKVLEDSILKTGLVRTWMENMTIEEHLVKSTFHDDEPMLFIADYPVYPKSIWELDSTIGRLLRFAAYGKSELARPVPAVNHLTPNIAHVIWTNDDPMPFNFYLCVLSLLEVAMIDKLYIHGDGPPTGKYWNLVRDHPKIRLVRRTMINHRFEWIYGTKVRKMAHVTDVWRADIMLRYGGLYVDTDVIFVRPLSREIRSYEAVLSEDISQRGEFPGSYQNGVMLGKPGAKFWELHIESMKTYVDSDWLWNSCFQTYKIKERHPTELHIDPHLNTICAFFTCYPSWIPDFKDRSTGHSKSGSMKHWREDAFAIHHTEPSVPELASHEALLKNNGSTLFGEVALFILERAGKLEYFQKLSAQENVDA